MKIVLATKNRNKLIEMQRMFSTLDIELLSLYAFPDCTDVEEDGKTFRANAIKKAFHVFRFTGYPSIADDSGLEVNALGGAPGVYSARYAGENADDQDNVRKLLKELKSFKQDQRKARFVCCIAIVLPDGKQRTFTGYVNGLIGKKQRGLKGFGYDPVFYPEGFDRTFAEMKGSEKDSLSHRGKAIRKLHAFLHKIL
jgi:XTP/dITP diphosphohydrolase